MRGARSFLALLAILVGLGAYLYFVEWKREPGTASSLDKVFAVESDAIEEITVRSEPGETTTLRRSGTDWQIVQPVTVAPDGAAVSALTSNLSRLEIQRVIDENPPDLAEYGLADPRVEVAFRAADREHRLQIGRKTPTGTDLYAKTGDEPKVFLISSYIDSTFNKSTFELRDKTVLKVDRDQIDALAVTTPKRNVKFEKIDGEWRMTEPLRARADFMAVDGLVSRLNTLQMQSIAADEAQRPAEYGLDRPAATVHLGSGSSQATLIVGKAAADGTVYVKDQARPPVLTVDASLVDELTRDPEEYRQKDLFDARAFNATHVEVTRGGRTVAFEKTTEKNEEGQDEERWKQVAPAAADVDQPALDNLISAVTLARASGFVDSTARTGLDKPELTITVKSNEGRREERVLFSRGGQDAYASRANEPGAAKLDASAVDNIVRALDEIEKPAEKTTEPEE